jgi:hypothetical protein
VRSGSVNRLTIRVGLGRSGGVWGWRCQRPFRRGGPLAASHRIIGRFGGVVGWRGFVAADWGRNRGRKGSFGGREGGDYRGREYTVCGAPPPALRATSPMKGEENLSSRTPRSGDPGRWCRQPRDRPGSGARRCPGQGSGGRAGRHPAPGSALRAVREDGGGGLSRPGSSPGFRRGSAGMTRRPAFLPRRGWRRSACDPTTGPCEAWWRALPPPQWSKRTNHEHSG